MNLLRGFVYSYEEELVLRSSKPVEIILRLSAYYILQLNPFVPSAPFPYPMKTSENRKVF